MKERFRPTTHFHGVFRAVWSEWIMGHQRGWDLVTPLFHGQYASACWLFMDGLKARTTNESRRGKFPFAFTDKPLKWSNCCALFTFLPSHKKVIKSKSNFLEKCMCGCENWPRRRRWKLISSRSDESFRELFTHANDGDSLAECVHKKSA